MSSFVYLLLDPLRYFQPFYVGKGSHDSRRAENRPKFHLREAMRGIKSAKCDRIREIVQAGQTYSILIWQDNLGIDEAYNLERELIERFGREHYDPDGVLTNIVVDNRHIDYNKVVYKRGPDHHSHGIKRPPEALRKQGETKRMLAELRSLYRCKCGCGIEVSEAQRNYAATSRLKHGIAAWHLAGLPHNHARSRKIKLLQHGLKDEQITPSMYLSKLEFAKVISEL